MWSISADPRGELCWSGLVHAQVGDRVDRFGGEAFRLAQAVSATTQRSWPGRRRPTRRSPCTSGSRPRRRRPRHSRRPAVKCRTPRRARGSGRCDSAVGNPAAVSGRAPVGAHDSAEISDDGDAGMAHFGQITRRRNLDDLRNQSCPPCCHQQGPACTNPIKLDTLTTLPGPCMMGAGVTAPRVLSPAAIRPGPSSPPDPALADPGRERVMGIADSGTSGLARILFDRGVPVSGCEAPGRSVARQVVAP
jgi:hypothetical protein